VERLEKRKLTHGSGRNGTPAVTFSKFLIDVSVSAARSLCDGGEGYDVLQSPSTDKNDQQEISKRKSVDSYSLGNDGLSCGGGFPSKPSPRTNRYMSKWQRRRISCAGFSGESCLLARDLGSLWMHWLFLYIGERSKSWRRVPAPLRRISPRDPS